MCKLPGDEKRIRRKKRSRSKTTDRRVNKVRKKNASLQMGHPGKELMTAGFQCVPCLGKFIGSGNSGMRGLVPLGSGKCIKREGPEPPAKVGIGAPSPTVHTGQSSETVKKKSQKLQKNASGQKGGGM